jgi:RNase P subunit RPR2
MIVRTSIHCTKVMRRLICSSCVSMLMPVSVNDMRHGEDDPGYRRGAS